MLLLLLFFLIDKLFLTFYTEMESAQNKNTVLKKEEVRGLILLGFKIYYKTVVVKTVVTGVRIG